MATISDSSLIIPQGKVGGFTFYKLNGKIVMRSLPNGKHRNKTHPSPLQTLYQKRLADVNAYLRPLKRVLDFGYQNFLDQKSGVNWAHTNLSTKGYNHNANPQINAAYLQISRGSLVGADEVKAVRETGGITLSWKDNVNEGNANSSDSVSILLNHPASKNHVWLEELCQRGDLTCVIPLSESNQLLEWEVYLVFHRKLNTKKNILSDSYYLGRV